MLPQFIRDITPKRLIRTASTLGSWLVTAWIVFGVCAALFIALNLICLGVFALFPEIQLTKAERVTRGFNIQFSSLQSEFAMRWLAIENQDELNAFFVENTAQSHAGGNVYEPFTEFKTGPWKGRFFNFTEAGYREVANQGPWPQSPVFFNIFVFGGSTTMGIGPDWATVPSYLQAHLDGSLIGGKPVRVYNFGRGSYFSTQERILFQQLLLDRHIPDLAIFFDGLNDFYFLDGRPSGWPFFEQAFREGTRRAIAITTGRESRYWQAFLDRINRLPLTQAAKIVADTLFPSKASPNIVFAKPETVPKEQLERVIDRYFENKRQIEAIAQAHSIATLFVWQPVPGYKYDLRYHLGLNPVYGLGGHERSSQGYPLMAVRRASGNLGNNFLWLADLQENRKESLYMDAVHYTAGFSKIIAQEIARALTKGDMVKR